MRDRSRSSFVKALLATIVVASVSACSSSNSSSNDRPETLETEIEASTRDRNSQRGLELRVLNVDDSGDRVARILAPYLADNAAMRSEDRDRWNQWGLRWVVVPQSKLDEALGSMDLTSAIQIRWMGEFPQWRPIIRTADLQQRPVRIGDPVAPVYRTLDGIPRLLARVWTKPELTEAGLQTKLHLDIAVQLKSTSKADAVWREPTLQTAIDEGPLIEELTMSQSLDDSSALILIGVDPAITWDSSAPSAQSDAQSRGAGPSTPTTRTLGQRMLSTSGSGYVAPGVRYNPPKKVLIVLVPKTDDHYRILAPTQSGKAGSP
jgi:hypothetical protein